MTTLPSDRLIRELRSVINDAERVLSAAAADTSDKAEHARRQAQRALRIARRRLERAERRTMRSVRLAADRTDRYVHNKPWRSMGVAAGAAFLAGCLMARR